MIVISAGLQRSGSGWIYNLTNELLVMAGHTPARQVRDRFFLNKVLPTDNVQFKHPSVWKLMAITLPHLAGHTFAVKTHSRPTRSMQTWMRWGWARAHYSYRDPRDVVVSVWDAGRRAAEGGWRSPFTQYQTIEAIIDAVAQWLRTYDRWLRQGDTPMIRYEQFKADPLSQLRVLADHYGLQLTDAQLQAAIDKFSEGKSSNLTHYWKAETGRFRKALSAEQVELCRQRFGDYIIKMGYDDA